MRVRGLEGSSALRVRVITMMEDSTVKSVDKQKMKGYYLKWQDA